MAKEHIYQVKGMHCASCEILIEKKLLDLENVKSVDASTVRGEVVIEYDYVGVELLDSAGKLFGFALTYVCGRVYLVNFLLEPVHDDRSGTFRQGCKLN